MAEKVTSTSGEKTSTGGDVVNKTVTTKTAADPGQTYDKTFVDKVLKEKGNQRTKIEELENELTTIKQTKLESDGKVTELNTALKEENTTLKTKLTNVEKTIEQGQVNTALRRDLVALGLDEKNLEKAFKLIDRTGVALDTETGTVIGSQDAAKRFFDDNSDLGFFKNKGVGVIQHAGVATVDKVDYSKMTIAEKADIMKKSGFLNTR